jgi:hypothetical protein
LGTERVVCGRLDWEYGWGGCLIWAAKTRSI